MTEHHLTLRPTVIGEDRLENDFSVWREGRNIGRIRLAENHVEHLHEWRWNINPPLPIPTWYDGTATTLERAKEHFRAAWEEFYARLSPETIKHWHMVDDACKWG